MEKEEGYQSTICACWKKNLECGKFQPIDYLKKFGLDVYRHFTTRAEDPCNDSDEAYDNHDASSIQLTNSEFALELRRNLITCPRCKSIITRAQHVLRNVRITNESHIFGVCANCSSRNKVACKCDEVLQYLIDRKIQHKDKRMVNLVNWLSNITTVLNDLRNWKPGLKVTSARPYCHKMESNHEAACSIDNIINRKHTTDKSVHVAETEPLTFDYNDKTAIIQTKDFNNSYDEEISQQTIAKNFEKFNISKNKLTDDDHIKSSDKAHKVLVNKNKIESQPYDFEYDKKRNANEKGYIKKLPNDADLVSKLKDSRFLFAEKQMKTVLINEQLTEKRKFQPKHFYQGTVPAIKFIVAQNIQKTNFAERRKAISDDNFDNDKKKTSENKKSTSTSKQFTRPAVLSHNTRKKSFDEQYQENHGNDMMYTKNSKMVSRRKLNQQSAMKYRITQGTKNSQHELQTNINFNDAKGTEKQRKHSKKSKVESELQMKPYSRDLMKHITEKINNKKGKSMSRPKSLHDVRSSGIENEDKKYVNNTTSTKKQTTATNGHTSSIKFDNNSNVEKLNKKYKIYPNKKYRSMDSIQTINSKLSKVHVKDGFGYFFPDSQKKNKRLKRLSSSDTSVGKDKRQIDLLKHLKDKKENLFLETDDREKEADSTLQDQNNIGSQKDTKNTLQNSKTYNHQIITRNQQKPSTPKNQVKSAVKETTRLFGNTNYHDKNLHVSDRVLAQRKQNVQLNKVTDLSNKDKPFKSLTGKTSKRPGSEEYMYISYDKKQFHKNAIRDHAESAEVFDVLAQRTLNKQDNRVIAKEKTIDATILKLIQAYKKNKEKSVRKSKSLDVKLKQAKKYTKNNGIVHLENKRKVRYYRGFNLSKHRRYIEHNNKIVEPNSHPDRITHIILGEKIQKVKSIYDDIPQKNESFLNFQHKLLSDMYIFEKDEIKMQKSDGSEVTARKLGYGDGIIEKIKESKIENNNMVIPLSHIKMLKPQTSKLLMSLIKFSTSMPYKRPITEIDMEPIILKIFQNHFNQKKAFAGEYEVPLQNAYTKPLSKNKPKGIIDDRITLAKHLIQDNSKPTANSISSPKKPKMSSPIHSEETRAKESSMKPHETKVDEEANKGVIHYALSDREYIEKGWTLLPTEKVVRKMNVYRMRPAKPEFDWFEKNKSKKTMFYDSGEKLAEIDDSGRGRWYYKNGRLALDYYNAEEINAQQRFVVYSNGEPDEKGRTHPVTVLAMFDYLGNGVVFDHNGKIRLKYNQTEGVVLDKAIGPVSNWKWHSLNDPPVLQQVMIDTQLSHKDPDILKMTPAEHKTHVDNEDMLAIEFDNFIKEKSKKLAQSFKPFQIKMKALKINEYFSLRVLDQASIYMMFRDGTTNLKLNLGMILDHQEIVDTDTAELGDVLNSVERFPARTDSLEQMQRSVAYAQRVERMRLERDRKMLMIGSFSSTDHLMRAASKPLQTGLSTVSKHTCNCQGPRRSQPCTNIYYDTRFI